MPVRLGAVALLVLAACASPRPRDPSPGLILEAIRKGDTVASFEALKDLYRANGISIGETLKLDLQRFDVPLSHYDQENDRIVLSVMPAPDQVRAYWENWSKATTD